jgi:hypothetical protein
MEIFAHHYGIFGAFPAGFRPSLGRVGRMQNDYFRAFTLK